MLALAPTLDHVGLLAPTVDAIADAPVAAAVDAALRALHDAGWELVDVTWPERGRVQEVTTAIMFAEAATVHRALLESHADRLGADVLARLGSDDGMVFCRELPERCGVVAVPNAVFYAHPERGRHLVRFAFCKRIEVLAEAAGRLATLSPR